MSKMSLLVDCRIDQENGQLNKFVPTTDFVVRLHTPAFYEHCKSVLLNNEDFSEVVVIANTILEIREFYLYSHLIGLTRRVKIIVLGKTPPSLLSAPYGIVGGRFIQEASRKFVNSPVAHTVVYVRISWPVSLKNAIAACIAGNMRSSRRVIPHSRLGIGPGVDSRWACGDFMARALPSTVLMDQNAGDNPGPRPVVDVVLSSSESLESPPDNDFTFAVSSGQGRRWGDIAIDGDLPSIRGNGSIQTKDRSLAFAPVDTEVINPIGFDSFALTDRARVRYLSESKSEIVNRDGSMTLAHLRNGRIDENAVTRLRGVCFVDDYAESHSGPRDRAIFLVEAAAAGVPVLPHGLDSLTCAYLPADLGKIYQETSEAVLGDRLGRESFVAAAHRFAYRSHSSRNGLDAALGITNGHSSPAVSVLIPSKRPEFLDNAVAQIRRQSWSHVEPIFGLHGYSLDVLSAETRQSLKDIGAQVFEAAPDDVFGDLMNSMTSLANGDLIAKMDDDDWYSEFHLEDLVHSLEYSRATLVGSGVQFVYLTHANITVRRSRKQAYRYGGHPGGPTLMLSRDDLKSVGNWSRVNRAIDTALNDAIVNTGGTIYQGNPLNFLFNRRSSGHTWNATNEYFLKGSIDQWTGLRPPPGFSAVATESVRSLWECDSSELAEIYTQTPLNHGDTRLDLSGYHLQNEYVGARLLRRP